jgi:hypothetical protein
MAKKIKVKIVVKKEPKKKKVKVPTIAVMKPFVVLSP